MSYDGETRARNPQVAVFLTMICPGLGYMYIGRLLRALTINLLFVLLVELFIISQSWLKFFPLLPGLVLLLGWALLTALVALDVRDLLGREEGSGEYVLKTYNHWVFYVLSALCTMYLPIALSVQMFLTGLWLMVPIAHDGMAPTLWRGDVVLVDRQGWRGEQLAMEAGELVAVGPARPDAPVFVLRVVAVEGEQVRVEHEHLYLRDELTQQRAPQEGELAGVTLPANLVPMVEELGAKIYPVLLARRGGVVSSVPQTKIEEGTIFLLTDNRGQVPLSEGGERMWDSRDVGAVPLDRVKGRPRYVWWSSDPETGAVRWDRIGLRLDVQDRAPQASEATAPKSQERE